MCTPPSSAKVFTQRHEATFVNLYPKERAAGQSQPMVTGLLGKPGREGHGQPQKTVKRIGIFLLWNNSCMNQLGKSWDLRSVWQFQQRFKRKGMPGWAEREAVGCCFEEKVLFWVFLCTKKQKIERSGLPLDSASAWWGELMAVASLSGWAFGSPWPLGKGYKLPCSKPQEKFLLTWHLLPSHNHLLRSLTVCLQK